MKNRSKFSAFRPHYERGRKECVVGEDQTEPNRTEQDRTGPNRTEQDGGGGRGPSLSVYGLREVVPGTGNRMQTKNVTHNAEVS